MVHSERQDSQEARDQPKLILAKAQAVAGTK